MGKIPQEIIDEAEHDIQFAKEKLKDPGWWNNACDMSRSMVIKNSQMRPLELAKEKWLYLTYRTNATSPVWGKVCYIDKAAREKWLSLKT